MPKIPNHNVIFLQPEIYEEKLSQSSKKSKSENNRANAVNVKNPMPKNLTCNVGFALRRYSQDNRKLSNDANK